MEKEVVIIDLDGVIIRGQSQRLFIGYLFKNKIIGFWPYFKIIFWFILYKIKFIKNPHKIMEYGISFFKGKNTYEIDKIIEDFFNAKLKNFISTEMVGIIEEHKKNGREIIILSNSLDILVKKISEFLSIKNYIATKLGVVGGKFTGKISGDIVYGESKKLSAERFLGEHNLSLNNSWAYGDHISDIFVLKMVEKPYAVNPDKFLHKEAIKNGWPILKF
jgi:HAD superfamily hydrolase (TIGR01490 family)